MTVYNTTDRFCMFVHQLSTDTNSMNKRRAYEMFIGMSNFFSAMTISAASRNSKGAGGSVGWCTADHVD